MGASVSEIDFTPFYEVARMLYEGAWVAERMTVIEDLLRRTPKAIHPVTRAVVGKADGLTAADAFRGIYRLAALKRAAEPLLAAVDCLCVPTIPTFYSLADLQADPIGPNSRLGTYTNFVNLMDLCGIAVPVAARGDGRPGSVTLLARAGGDGLVAGLAEALHRDAGVTLGATGWPQPAGHASGPAATADEMVLAVVGAHMTGLPLNGALTSRGGRFLEATATAPAYRLHALAGGPPARPGLIRVDKGGTAIALELWALPKAMVGDFLATVPSPLSLGRVTLADGRVVTGFLVEQAGLTDARDISAHGGWRAFLAAEATQP
jgi:allophanate hydrolase